MMLSSHVLLIDATAQAVLDLCPPLPPQWSVVVAASAAQPLQLDQKLPAVRVPTGVTADCSGWECACDRLIAQLPERAVVVAVLLQEELRCLALLADILIASRAVAQWCRVHGIPATVAESVDHARTHLLRYVHGRSYRRRYQAQLYRKHRVETE